MQIFIIWAVDTNSMAGWGWGESRFGPAQRGIPLHAAKM